MGTNYLSVVKEGPHLSRYGTYMVMCVSYTSSVQCPCKRPVRITGPVIERGKTTVHQRVTKTNTKVNDKDNDKYNDNGMLAKYDSIRSKCIYYSRDTLI